jgi:hypothetical protein
VEGLPQFNEEWRKWASQKNLPVSVVSYVVSEICSSLSLIREPQPLAQSQLHSTVFSPLSGPCLQHNACHYMCLKSLLLYGRKALAAEA